MLLLTLTAASSSRVDVYRIPNATGFPLFPLSSWESVQGAFGGGLSDTGISGILSVADPVTACGPITNASGISSQFVLIRRGGGTNCTFGQKVFNAQQAGYEAAIIFDDADEGQLVEMDYHGSLAITIPSVFVSKDAGVTMSDWVNEYGNDMVLADIHPEVFIMKGFLFTVVTIMTGIFIVFTIYLIYRRRRIASQYQPKERMTRRQILKLPKRGYCGETDKDEMCCICLEKYSEKDTITTLPCGHFFHHDCIKPWLQDQQRCCPICKRDPLDNDERTPLLGPRIDTPDANTESTDDATDDIEPTGDGVFSINQSPSTDSEDTAV